MHIGKGAAMEGWHGGMRAGGPSHFTATTVPPSTRYRDPLLGATIPVPQSPVGPWIDGSPATPDATIAVQTHVDGAIWKGICIASPIGLAFWIFIAWLSV
jgi:hypothetical protein